MFNTSIPFEESWNLGGTLERATRGFFDKLEALTFKEQKGGILIERKLANGVKIYDVTFWE